MVSTHGTGGEKKVAGGWTGREGFWRCALTLLAFGPGINGVGGTEATVGVSSCLTCSACCDFTMNEAVTSQWNALSNFSPCTAVAHIRTLRLARLMALTPTRVHPCAEPRSSKHASRRQSAAQHGVSPVVNVVTLYAGAVNILPDSVCCALRSVVAIERETRDRVDCPAIWQCCIIISTVRLCTHAKLISPLLQLDLPVKCFFYRRSALPAHWQLREAGNTKVYSMKLVKHSNNVNSRMPAENQQAGRPCPLCWTSTTSASCTR